MFQPTVPQEVGSEEKPTPSLRQQLKGGVKKSFLIILIAIPVVILGYLLLISPFGFIAIMVGGSLLGEANVSKLSEQIASTPDTIVSSYQCGSSDYSWKVIEKDALYGTGFPATNASIYTRRVLQLFKGDRGFALNDGVNDVAPSRDFPIAEHFTKAIVMGKKVFEQDTYPGGTYIHIDLLASSISPEDFDLVSRCLHADSTQIERDLHAKTSIPVPVKQPYTDYRIGWTMRIDDSLERIDGFVTYVCTDGSIAAIRHNYIDFFKQASDVAVGQEIALDTNIWVNRDGSIAKGGDAIFEIIQPSSLPHCVDSKGESLADFISTLYLKIEFLESLASGNVSESTPSQHFIAAREEDAEATNTRQVTLYYFHTNNSGQYQYESTQKSIVSVPRIADATLKALFIAYLPELQNYYMDVSLSDGVARVSFKEGAYPYVASQTPGIAAKYINSINKTLLQFETIRRVEYMVGGKLISHTDA